MGQPVLERQEQASFRTDLLRIGRGADLAGVGGGFGVAERSEGVREAGKGMEPA